MFIFFIFLGKPFLILFASYCNADLQNKYVVRLNLDLTGLHISLHTTKTRQWY